MPITETGRTVVELATGNHFRVGREVEVNYRVIGSESFKRLEPLLLEITGRPVLDSGGAERTLPSAGIGDPNQFAEGKLYTHHDVGMGEVWIIESDGTLLCTSEFGPHRPSVTWHILGGNFDEPGDTEQWILDRIASAIAERIDALGAESNGPALTV